MALGTNAPHKKIPHGSSAHEFFTRNYPTGFSAHLHIRTDFSHKDLLHIFFINKSCLNFNKIVFIETIGKKSLKYMRKKIQNCAEDPCAEDSVRKIRAIIPCGRSVQKILVRKILCGQFLKKLCGAFVPIAVQ